MAATDSKREDIIVYLKNLLAGIRVADDYWHDLSDDQVSRRLSSMDDIEAVEMPYLIIQSGDENLIEDQKFVDEAGRVMQIFLLGFIKSDSPPDADTDFERFVRDVKKKLNSDLGLGSNARTMTIEALRTDLGVVAFPEYGVFVMELSIEYMENYASP